MAITEKNSAVPGAQAPRYHAIATALTKQRKDIDEPVKLPSEEALAVEHNVARDTVRRAMQLLEKQGAVTRHRGRGTFLMPQEPAIQELAGMGVGVIPPRWADSMQAWYTSTVFGGVYEKADENDWHLSVFHVPRKGMHVHDLLKKMSTRALKGLIWVHPVAEQLELLKAIAEKIPCVVVGREYPNTQLHTIGPDYEMAARLLDEHLVSQGHTVYGVVGRSARGWYSGTWITALEKAHTRRGATFAYWDNYVNSKPFDRYRLAELISEFYLPVHPEVRALVLTSSSYLEPLLASTRLREMVGHDLSLAAFDYGIRSMDSYWPGHTVTHVSCDWRRIGRRAMDVLAMLLGGQKEMPRLVREPVSFVSGDTVVARPTA